MWLNVHLLDGTAVTICLDHVTHMVEGVNSTDIWFASGGLLTVRELRKDIVRAMDSFVDDVMGVDA